MTTCCFSCLGFSGDALTWVLDRMLQLCDASMPFAEICWQSGQVSKSAVRVRRGPGSGGAWEVARTCNFVSNCHRCLAFIDSTFTFSVMCEQPLRATPCGNSPFPEASVWTLCGKATAQEQVTREPCQSSSPQDTPRETETLWKKLYFLECMLKRQIMVACG